MAVRADNLLFVCEMLDIETATSTGRWRLRALKVCTHPYFEAVVLVAILTGESSLWVLH